MYEFNGAAALLGGRNADGSMYATWVVGASRIREVQPGWPGVGSRVHHCFGLWPLLIDDHTEVLTSDPDVNWS